MCWTSLTRTDRLEFWNEKGLGPWGGWGWGWVISVVSCLGLVETFSSCSLFVVENQPFQIVHNTLLEVMVIFSKNSSDFNHTNQRKTPNTCLFSIKQNRHIFHLKVVSGE